MAEDQGNQDYDILGPRRPSVLGSCVAQLDTACSTLNPNIEMSSLGLSTQQLFRRLRKRRCIGPEVPKSLPSPCIGGGKAPSGAAGATLGGVAASSQGSSSLPSSLQQLPSQTSRLLAGGDAVSQKSDTTASLRWSCYHSSVHCSVPRCPCRRCFEDSLGKTCRTGEATT